MTHSGISYKFISQNTLSLCHVTKFSGGFDYWAYWKMTKQTLKILYHPGLHSQYPELLSVKLRSCKRRRRQVPPRDLRLVGCKCTVHVHLFVVDIFLSQL